MAPGVWDGLSKSWKSINLLENEEKEYSNEQTDYGDTQTDLRYNLYWRVISLESNEKKIADAK